MAEKLLTLIQDTTGDEIYPNIKEGNIPSSVKEKINTIDTKQDKLTDTQMYAVNSGITQYKVGVYDGYDNQIKGKQDKITASTVNPFVKTEDGTGIDLYQITLDTNGNLSRGPVVDQIPSDSWIQGELDKKQDNLTTNQLSAVNSGITQTKVATYDGYNATISRLDVDLSNTINEVNHKQDELVSGTNIKTINGQSILGSGDLPISGGGESVSPTLSLVNIETHTVRTTITEQEKINLEKGLYNQVIYTDLSSRTPYEMFAPSKLFYMNGDANFANFDPPNIVGDTPSFSSISVYRIRIVENTTSGEYPIEFEKQFSINLGSEGYLYNHDIEITFQYDQNQASYHVYLNVVSSKNLNVNSINNLKALLGNTFKRSCTSGNDNTAQQEVIAISNNGFEFNDFTSILFSEVTNINITDTVTTI